MTPKQSLSKSDIKKVCDILRRDDGVGAKNYVEQLSWLLFLKVFENVEGELRELAEAEGKKYQNIIDPEYQWSTWAKKDWKDKDELVHFINQKLFPYLKTLKGSKEKDKIGEVFRELSGNLIRSAHNLLDIIDILDQIEMKHFQDSHLLSQTYEEVLQEMGSEGGWAGEFYTPRPIIRLMVKIVNPKIGETIFDPFVGSGGFLIESFDYLQKQIKNIGVKEWNTLQNKTFSGQEKLPLPYLIGTMNMMLHRILVPNLTRTNTFMEDIHNITESSKKDVVLTNPPFGGTEHQSVQNNFPIPISATEGLALQYVMKYLKNGGRCGIILPEGQILFGGGTFQKIRQELLEKFNVHSIISLPAGAFAQMGAGGIKTNLIFFDKTGSTKEIWYGEVGGKFTKKHKMQDDNFEEIFTKWQKREISENSWTVSIKEIQNRNYSLSAKNPNKCEEEEISTPKEIINNIKNLQKESYLHLEKIENLYLQQNLNSRNWKLESIMDLSSVITSGGTPLRSNQDFWKNGTIKWLTIGDFKDFDLIINTREKITEIGLKNSSAKIFKKGTVIISIFATLGRVGILGEEMATNQALAGITPKDNIYNRYLMYALKTKLSEIEELSGGVAQKNINLAILKKIKIPVPYKNNIPDMDEQKRIVDIWDKVFLEQFKYEQVVNKISKSFVSFKKSLLKDLFIDE